MKVTSTIPLQINFNETNLIKNNDDIQRNNLYENNSFNKVNNNNNVKQHNPNFIRVYTYKNPLSCVKQKESFKKDKHLELLIKQDYTKEKRITMQKKQKMNIYGNNLNNNFTFLPQVKDAEEDSKFFEENETDKQVNNNNVNNNNNKTTNHNNSINAEINTHVIDESDLEIIKTSLSTHFLFCELSESTINIIAQELFLFQMDEGSILFSEGDKGFFFFIVKSGKLELSISNQQHVKTFTRGDTFGELALIQQTKRSGTVTCIEAAEIYFLDGKIFRDTIYNINKDDFISKMHSINLLPLFQFISTIDLYNVSDHLIKNVFEPNTTIIKQNEYGESLYIIKEGYVSCSNNDGFEVRKLGPNDFFGENSILFESQRTLTVTSLTRVKLYQISKSDLYKCLGKNFKETLLFSIVKNSLLNKTKSLKYLLVNDFFERLKSKCELLGAKENEIIIKKEQYYIEQCVLVVITGNINCGSLVYGRGDVFGEEYLPRSRRVINIDNDVIASSNCVFIRIKWKDVISLIEINNLKEHKVLQFFEIISHIKNIQLFKHISDYRLVEISKRLKKKSFKINETIITENSPSSYVYFLYRGRVHIYKNQKYIREYQDYACFGEISVLQHINHTASVIAVTKASVFLLSSEDFFMFIDSNMRDYLYRKFNLFDNFNIELDKLMFIKMLGKGKFGSVSLVCSEDKYNKNLYAIKSVSKKLAEKNKILTKYFKNEREILLKLEHPFIIKLIKTFQNKDNVFYLMEFINGCELSNYLSQRKPTHLYNKEETQFYIASLLLIITYLNSKNIIHRDIKPDNIMINESGYITLIDFNTCREIKDLSSTLAGTPHYMAPEILIGKGYGLSVDYWSIGVLCFYLYFGYLPFGNGLNDPIEIYKDIIRGKISYPIKDEVSEFINNLIKKNVWERMCSLELLKRTRLFEMFNWNELIDLKLKPFFIPKPRINVDELVRKGNYCVEKYNDFLNKEGKVQEIEEDESESDDDSMEMYDVEWDRDF